MAGEGNKELSLKGLNVDLEKLLKRVDALEKKSEFFDSKFAWYYDERGLKMLALIHSVYPARKVGGELIPDAPPLADLLLISGGISGGVEKTTGKPMWLPVYDEHGDLAPKRKQWHPFALPDYPARDPEKEQNRKLFAEGANEPAKALATAG